VATKYRVIAIFGPTAVGKTAVAVKLAELLRKHGYDPVAVSADALQLYRGLEVLTGAPSAQERAALEHRLVGVADPADNYSAGRYATLAHAEIDRAVAAGRVPIVVGGTGLYLRAALSDLDLRPPTPPAVRERLVAELKERGPLELHRRLSRLAPQVAARIAPTDSQRVVRALELLEVGEQPPGEGRLWAAPPRHPTLLIGLTMARPLLYRRIDRRVEEMVRNGALDEVKRAREAGVSPTVEKALGFRELLAGDVEGMKRRTRQYAKRQLTWLRKLQGVVVIEVGEGEEGAVAARIAELFLAGAGHAPAAERG